MALLEFFNFLHFIGLAWGLGGATCAAIISSKAEKNKELTNLSMKVMPAISKFIFMGLILLIISGIALPFFIGWPLDKNMLIVKHVLVAWIVIIGIFLGSKSKKMVKFSPKQNEKPSWQFIKTKKQVKAFSIINLVLWYVVTFLSVFV